jgi:hypothetical protein
MLSVALLAGAALVAVSFNSPAPASAATAPSATAAPPCPDAYTCVTIPCATSPCPTVEAGPTANLGATGSAQYVFVDLYDFPAADTPVVWYCADTTPLANGPPLCSISPAPQQLPVFSDGTALTSYQVQEVENDGGTSPLSGEVPGDPSSTGTFFCDDGSNPCSLDVFDEALDGSKVPDPSNTAVFPISFVPDNSGCPKGTVVNSESDFGIEGLLTQTAPAACTGIDPAVPVNTAQDSLGAVQALASGAVQIAYTDDPNAADEQTALTGTGTTYAYIPVAASADVVGFSADESETTDPFVLYPASSFELTPDMVAGLITMQDSSPGSADALAGQSCPNPLPGKPTSLKPCPALEALNAVSGFLPQAFYWANVRSDNAGVTDEFFNWLCTTPDESLTIAGVAHTEGKTASQVLEAAPWSNQSQKQSCPDTDQFPGLSGSGDWVAASTPPTQARDVMNEVANEVPQRVAAFAPMNWYEALYYGLDVASLENGAGDYVAPTAQSVDAALADATVNSATGALSYDYTDTNAAAYPTPVVIYAVVPTNLPSSMEGAVSTELRTVLAVTTAAGGAGVPQGLLPLPSNLATEAMTTVNTDFPAPTASTSPTGPSGGSGNSGGGTTTTTTVPTSTGPGSSDVSGAADESFGGVGTGVLDRDGAASSGLVQASQKAPVKTAVPKQKVQNADFLGLVPPGGRLLLIVLLGAGAGAIIIGPAILALLRERRRPKEDVAR